MLHEQTHDKLVAMRLHGMAAVFEQALDDGQGDALSWQDRVGMMVDREWGERQDRSLKRRLQLARLREPACMEDLDYRHPTRKLDRALLQRLASCEWIREHENLVLTGPTGIGKTWIACALGNKVCRDGFSVLYKRVPRLLHHLEVARADGSYARELARLARTDLLILDDWGLAKLRDDERRDLLEVFEDRHGLRSTLVASQIPVSKWHDTVGDPTIADALMDRLIHHAHRIELQGPSLRNKQAKGKASGSAS